MVLGLRSILLKGGCIGYIGGSMGTTISLLRGILDYGPFALKHHFEVPLRCGVVRVLEWQGTFPK